jgi:hypothetical protein
MMNVSNRSNRARSPRAVLSLCLRLALATLAAVVAWQALASVRWVSTRVTLARGYLADVRDITDLAAGMDAPLPILYLAKFLLVFWGGRGWEGRERVCTCMSRVQTTWL